MNCKYCGQPIRMRYYEAPGREHNSSPEHQELAAMIEHYHYCCHQGEWPPGWKLIHKPYTGWACPLCDWRNEGWYLLLAEHIIDDHGGVEPFETMLSLHVLSGES